ncbi:Uncharacterised protein [Dorea longicatena]|nr:Uncharacterised protein [Dorea longicatena]
MNIRNCIKIYITVNTRKPEEILIFTPTACRPFEHLDCQFILPFFYIICQFKFRRCKGILTITRKHSIHPKCKSAFCSLKGNKESFSFHFFRHHKIIYIACNRIKMFRYFSGMNIFMPFPWILYICILRHIISFHLNMCRYIDFIPVSAGIFFRLESFNRTFVISCIMEFPHSIQAITIR